MKIQKIDYINLEIYHNIVMVKLDLLQIIYVEVEAPI